MSPSFKSWLRNLDVAYRRKQQEWRQAQAEEMYVPERGFASGERVIVTYLYNLDTGETSIPRSEHESSYIVRGFLESLGQPERSEP